MVEMRYGRFSNCFWLVQYIAFLVVVFGFLSNHNRFQRVTATANNNNNNNNNNNKSNNGRQNSSRRFKSQADGEEMYSRSNSLCREENIYTSTSRRTGSIFSRIRRNPSTHSPTLPLATRIHDTEDVSATMIEGRTQRRHLATDDGTTAPGEFPLQSADIGSRSRSSSTGVQSQFYQKPSSNREHGNRKWFPIEFRRQKSRLDVGYSIDDSQKRKRFPRHSATNVDDSSSMSHNSTAATTTTGSGNANNNKISSFTTTALVAKAGDAFRQVTTTATAVTATSHHPPSSRTSNSKNKNNVQVSLSLDPFSLGTLIHSVLSSSAGIASVYIATLKLLGPMIIAKRCLTTVGYIFYDHYNGRYLRTTYNKRIRYLQEYDVIAAARAATRSLLQILCMGCAGRFVGFVLDRTPCVLQPSWVCHLWYGVVWLVSIYAIGWACQEWGFGYLAKKNKYIHPLVSIQPITETTSYGSNSNNTRKRRKKNAVQLPWQFVVQRMRDPEEWVNSLLRVPRRKERYYYSSNSKTNVERTYPTQAPKSDDDPTKMKIKLDTLLFPSTWRPLFVLTFLALSRAMYLTFSASSSDNIMETTCRNNRYLIMRSFIIQKTLYSEWHRVFVQEQRVALGAGVSVIGLLALLWSIYAVSNVDRIAALALVPNLMARLVSGWMNILLYYNRCGISPP